MWISRAEYENLKSVAKNNKNDADAFRKLIEYIKEKKTVVHNDFVFVSYDVWSELTSKFSSEEDKVKDIQAELEWYKVKYHEMKMDAYEDKERLARCKDCALKHYSENGNLWYDIFDKIMPENGFCCFAEDGK